MDPPTIQISRMKSGKQKMKSMSKVINPQRKVADKLV